MSDDLGADDSSNVLSKADEFLRRRRAQLGNAAMEGPPRVDAPGAVADDIPVLTDIVSEDGTLAQAESPATEQRDLSQDVAREMDAWLDENLPQVVVHALDGITDRLISQIHESARADLLPRLRSALDDAQKRGREQD